MIISGNERGPKEGPGVEAIEEAIVILIGILHEIQDLHLLDAEAHRLAFVVPYPHVRLIHTFHLAEVVADQMTGDAGHLLIDVRLRSHDPGLEVPLVEDTKMTILQDRAVDIRQVDLELLHVRGMADIGIRGFGDVVMIEQHPIHLQKPLAHVRSDEVEKDAPPLYHLVALHRL